MLFESRFITGRHGNGEPDEQTSREVVHYENEARATRRSTLGQAELTVELAKRYGHLPPKTSVAPIENLDGNRVELTVSIPSGWLIHAAAVPLPADEKARPGEL